MRSCSPSRSIRPSTRCVWSSAPRSATSSSAQSPKASHDGELPPQNASVVAAALVGAIGEALVGPLATGTEDPDTVPTLIQFAHRALGAVDATHP